MISKLLTFSGLIALAASFPFDPFFTATNSSGPSCNKDDSKELSCHNKTTIPNTCCFNHPGGQILLTQFWDSEPAQGPKNSWTLHGLWPDNCDGSYEKFCDKSREVSDVTSILKKKGLDELLGYMQDYWKSNDGDDDGFWQHEWNKHGTCMSTYEPSCYPSHQESDEVADYFIKSVELFKQLDTYKFFEAEGILPSTEKTYTLEELNNAIIKNHGKPATLNCKSGRLNEVWYHYNVYGSAQSGKWVAADLVGKKGTCPSSGIKYLPKSSSGGGENPTPTQTPKPTNSPGPTPTGNPGNGTIPNGKGFLNVSSGGCLISTGKWYKGGTCATFTATPNGNGFGLKSSKGVCGIVNGEVGCGSTASAGVFALTGGKLTLYADQEATNGVQVPVYTVKGSRKKTLDVTWKNV